MNPEKNLSQISDETIIDLMRATGDKFVSFMASAGYGKDEVEERLKVIEKKAVKK